MQIQSIAVLGLTLFTFGCATAPRSPEDQATFHSDSARASAAKGNCSISAYELETAAGLPTGKAKVKGLLSNDTKTLECYYSYLDQLVTGVNDARTAATAYKSLADAKGLDIVASERIDNLMRSLRTRVTDGNVSGTVAIELGTILESFPDYFPDLRLPNHQRIIVNRTISNLQRNEGNRPVKELMQHVEKNGIGSDEGRRIESLLPTLKIRRDEIQIIEPLFPQFAAKRRKEMTTRVVFQVKNADRLFEDDLRKKFLGTIRGIEWSSVVDPTAVTLFVEKLRNDERIQPERTETITYSQGQVNFLASALLMPRNASYLYEVISGGAEIEYGYVVSAYSGGRSIFDEVVRGRVGSETRRCQNARIQNVFGGVSSAEFVANDDMQSRCNGAASVSIDSLRNDVLTKIVESVLRVPPISATHSLN